MPDDERQWFPPPPFPFKPQAGIASGGVFYKLTPEQQQALSAGMAGMFKDAATVIGWHLRMTPDGLDVLKRLRISPV